MSAIELRGGLPASQPAGAAAEPLDVVFVEGLQAATVIGIHDTELHVPQPVRIDLAAGVPRALACRSDRIGDTIDYGSVRAAVLEVLRTHRVQLLEALAEQIAQCVLDRFGAHWVRVIAAKPRKFADVESVGVAIERRRDPRQREASVLHLIGSGMVPGRTGDR